MDGLPYVYLDIPFLDLEKHWIKITIDAPKLILPIEYPISVTITIRIQQLHWIYTSPSRGLTVDLSWCVSAGGSNSPGCWTKMPLRILYLAGILFSGHGWIHHGKPCQGYTTGMVSSQPMKWWWLGDSLALGLPHYEWICHNEKNVNMCDALRCILTS